MKLRFRNDRGQALVEVALVIPVLTLLLLGAIELGRIAYFAIEVESAARTGASYGAVNVANAFASPSTIQQAAKDDAPDLPNLVVTPGTACVCETLDTSTSPATATYSSSFGATTSCPTSKNPNATISNCTGATQSVVDYVTVSTAATVNPIIHLPGIPTSFTLHGYCEMRILQN